MNAPDTHARALLHAFLLEHPDGDRAAFEALRARHPEHEAELERVYSQVDKLGEALHRNPASIVAGMESSLAPDDSRPNALSFFKRGEHERPQPAPGLEVGKVIGDFRLIELIGQGGMGQVWEAAQVSLGDRRVAVKFVRPERVTEKQLSYFEREARAGGRLAHPGIVAIHGFGESDGVAWIAMELVEGCWTLRDFLDDTVRANEVPEGYDGQVARFVAQLAQAMQAAHEGGVIHRDLKPQNVMITPEETPKVTDFGLARITDESALSQTGDFAGTYFYMSPEQVAAKRTGIDHRTDIFSLGVVMYEMLALRRPFQGDTTHQVAQQIMWRDAPDMRVVRSRIPRDLSVICGKALEKDPDKRYATMAELAADIERHLANEPIHAKPPTRVERVVKWTKRNPTKSVASAVAAVAFVVISGLGLRISKQKDDLETTNTALKTKTEEAQANADQARANADEARANAAEAERKTADVLRLSLAQDYEDLMSEAAELWPAYPEKIDALAAWISDAHKLTAEIPTLAAKRDDLRALALPQTEEERRAERASHADLPELQRVEGELVFRRRALAQRRDGDSAALPELDWSVAPADAAGLAARASRLVDGARTSFGQEALGLVLAERAIEMASDEERSSIAETLSQAYFALGRDEEALGLAFMALEEAPDDDKAARRAALAGLEQAAAEMGSERGLAAEAKTIAALEARLSALHERVDQRRLWTFPEETEQETRARWWHNQLSGLIGELESLSVAGVGLLADDGVSVGRGWSVARRLAFAERLRDKFAEGGEFAMRWEEALPQVHAAYPGLGLVPQMGLVPIGADPGSGLWEFWHVQTGTEPVRGVDGKLVMKEGSGLVLVLLPGGRFWMGAQSGDAQGRNYDKDAGSDEKPAREVELSAFFLSKYEMTQGQWERLTGMNPSRWRAETLPSWIEGAHPVEQVNWWDCMGAMARLGLSLPSEAQWEYGCRARTDLARPFAFEEFARHANIADLAYARAITSSVPVEEWDDGLGAHAPVGRLLSNDFGLHDVLGNVWEWCLDGYDSGFYGRGPVHNPVSPDAGSSSRVSRGGGFDDPAIVVRSANRVDYTPSIAVSFLGLRPARVIEP